MVLGKSFRVYHKLSKDNVYSLLIENRTDKRDALLVQSDAIAVLDEKDFETTKAQYSLLVDAYGLLGVLQLAVGESSHVSFLILVTGCVSVGKILESEVFRITDVAFISLRKSQSDIEKIQEVRRLLSAGTFYFAWTPPGKGKPLDLTLCVQRTQRTEETDNRFFWNRLYHLPLLRNGVDTSRWLIKAMCGGISISTVYVGHYQARAAIISRLSSERAGTRFQVRGVNDEGHTANFVETEQVIYLDKKVTSYVLVRGSVPLFWEQPGVQVGSHKVRMSRGSEISQPAYDRHLAMLKKRYGNQFIVTLCGGKEGETMLTKMYKAHHKASKHGKDVPFVAFDYHAHCQRGKEENLTAMLKPQIIKAIKAYGMFYTDGDRVHRYQNGTFRINCVDCLDRTNRVQTFIGLEILASQIECLGVTGKPGVESRFQEVFKNMWTLNGDQVSKIYAGTGALEGKSKLKDSTLSVARTIQNNLLDTIKQEAMDILLTGKTPGIECVDRAKCLLPSYLQQAHTSLLSAMCAQYLQYTRPLTTKLVVGTWNVNGGKHFNSIIYKTSDPLSDWLLDYATKSKKKDVPNIMDLSLNDSLSDISDANRPADIFAIGFEEIVDLNAGNIVSASTTNQKEWLVELQKTISRNHNYVLVTSVQLVGVCLFVYVLPKHAAFIRDVAIDQVKTGLGGAAGNKGGVAIRMNFYGSSLCFVCSHFAAGQHQVVERNADYTEISRKISFPHGRSLNSHDYIFWCGDFNYRIDGTNEEVKDLINYQNWEQLLDLDQLKVQIKEGKVFKKYLEGPVNFAPTYKYDMNSEEYDTSEKCRIPAWTDRILFRKRHPTRPDEELSLDTYGKIVFYGRAELKTSDHRPVVAELEVDVLQVEESKRDEILEQVLLTLGPPDASILVSLDEENHPNQNLADVLTGDGPKEVLKYFASQVGEIVFGRFIQNKLRISFRDSQSALNAMDYNGVEVAGVKIKVELQTPDWVTAHKRELTLIQDNSICLIDQDLEDTGEDFENLGPQLDPNALCVEDDDMSETSSNRVSPSPSCDGSDGSNRPGSRTSTPTHAPARPPPPSRPAPPTKFPEPIDVRPHSAPARPAPAAPVRPAPPPPAAQKPAEKKPENSGKTIFASIFDDDDDDDETLPPESCPSSLPTSTEQSQKRNEPPQQPPPMRPQPPSSAPPRAPPALPPRSDSVEKGTQPPSIPPPKGPPLPQRPATGSPDTQPPSQAPPPPPPSARAPPSQPPPPAPTSISRPPPIPSRLRPN